MPKVECQLESTIARTFRVEQVAGLFDVDVGEKSTLHVQAHLPGPCPGLGEADENEGFRGWQIGAIVGPSGSGKSQLAKRAYGSHLVERFTWPADSAVVDGFDQSLGMDQITGTLTAVGFSEPPSWVLPYQALSTGQRMRCDLARALLEHNEVVAFDEFTSVVDRQVGRFASAAVAKAIRKRRVPVERFVAVTCHHDVLDWLEPDWVLDMSDRRLTISPDARIDNTALARLPRGWVRRAFRGWQRPTIQLKVRRVDAKAYWPLFKRHHYLDAKLHPAAGCYVAFAPAPGSGHTGQETPVALCATLSNAGHKGKRRISRLVVLPDYQGLGIGLRLLERVAALEHAQGYGISISTSHPALIAALRTGGPSGRWRVGDVARSGSSQHGALAATNAGVRSGSGGRTVASFRYQAPGNGD
jgi:energy-coupling factor transporter ATP-binding protein EcfA2